MVTIFTFLVYLCYLVFQFFSHKLLYKDDGADVQQSVEYPSNVAKKHHINMSSAPRLQTDHEMDPTQRDARSVEAGSEEEEKEKPKMRLQMIFWLLVFVTVVCQCLIFLVALGSDRA